MIEVDHPGAPGRRTIGNCLPNDVPDKEIQSPADSEESFAAGGV
jgi:hypothetical protein